MSDPMWLHIYPPALWHERAVIMGSQAALRRLGEALIEAADKGDGIAPAFMGDGEGYWVEVLRLDELQEQVLNGVLRCPYVNELAGGPVTANDLPHRIHRRITAAHERRRQESAGEHPDKTADL